MYQPAQSSIRLLECLIKLETPERSEAKMELVLRTNELMPAGKPKFLEVIKYPMIKTLIEKEGKRKMLAVLVLLIKDFCSSINVVRNMNEDQMIEAAAMLMEECGNFRMEDYVMMFTMAKRGVFHPQIKIMDRIDIQLISSILDEYWKHRHEAETKKQVEEAEFLDNNFSENPADRKNLIWNDVKGYIEQKTDAEHVLSFASAIEGLKTAIKESREIIEKRK
jgi:hypothetical protein